MKQVIILAADHAGFSLKESTKRHLTDNGFLVEDCGADFLNEPDDYPDFVIPAAEKVVQKNTLGIVFGGSGQGEAMAANKVPGARAAVYYGGNPKILTLSKEHNNANILSLGARFLSEKEAMAAIDAWLESKFTNEMRHARRLKKMHDYEAKCR